MICIGITTQMVFQQQRWGEIGAGEQLFNHFYLESISCLFHRANVLPLYRPLLQPERAASSPSGNPSHTDNGYNRLSRVHPRFRQKGKETPGFF